MRPRHEVETARNLLANAEMALLRSGGISPEQKVYLMGVRAGLAYALGYPKGGRKVTELLEMIRLDRALSNAVGPLIGTQALEALRDPKPEGPIEPEGKP